MSRQIVNHSDPDNHPRYQLSHCLCHYSPGVFCGVCGEPYINFPKGGSFQVRGGEEEAWRCVVWASSRGGSYKSTPFTNSLGTYRVVYDGERTFREKLHPGGVWRPAGWYTNHS